MSKTNNKQFGVAFLLFFFFVSNLFWIGGVLINFKQTPYKEIRTLGSHSKKLIKRLANRNTQTANQQTVVAPDNITESSVLPLEKRYFSLDKYNLDLATTRLKIADDKIILLDSLGENLIFDGKQIIDTHSDANILKASLQKKQAIATYAINAKGHEEIFLNKGDKLANQTRTPFFAFVPAVGITSIFKLEGFHKRWDSDLLVASSEMQSLYRLKIVEDRVVFSEPIWIGHPVIDIIQLKNNIVLLTKDAQLISLVVEEEILARNIKGNDMMAMLPILSKCTSCHQFTPTTPLSMAPSLENILNKKIGSDPLFGRYTIALKNKDGIWDAENLRQYIKNPATFIPGTAMPAIGLNDDEVEAIVNTLSNPLRK